MGISSFFENVFSTKTNTKIQNPILSSNENQDLNVCSDAIKKQKKTKHNHVKEHLVRFGTIDTWKAIELYGATRLSAIIFRLREQGLNIVSLPESKLDRNGNVCNYVIYKLEE